MDEVKRKSTKIKRKKREVKNAVALYLQRRNYYTLQTFMVTKRQRLTHSLVETSVGRSNSILNIRCDPIVIDQNFTKFLLWLRDQTKFKNRFHDIECIVAPLFCHLYMEILRYEQADRAASFFKCHVPSINKNNCDNTIIDLIFANETKDKDLSKFKERFRSSRIVLKLQSNSLKNLKVFVLENCHIGFLQVLQTYFDFQVNDITKKQKRVTMPSIEYKKDYKHQKFLNCLRELKREETAIFNINITNNKHLVSCGLLKRQCGLLVFAQHNVLYLMPVHPSNSLYNINHNAYMKFVHHSNHIYSVDLSPDNQMLVSGSADGTLCIYSLETLTLLKKCTGHLGAVYYVKISGNGAYVATGSMDGTARLWEIKKGKILRIFCGHSQAVTCVEFHPNCLYLATGSADRNIRLWCINKASSLRLLHASKGMVYSLAFSPCGKLLASASEDKSIRVWDLLTSKVVIELKCKDAPILKVIWKSDGSEICAGTIDGVIRIWNISRTHDNGENNKYIDPITTHFLNGKLLSIDYAFSTYGTLTV